MIHIGFVRLYIPAIIYNVLMMLAGGAIERGSYWIFALFLLVAAVMDVAFDLCKPHVGE